MQLFNKYYLNTFISDFKERLKEKIDELEITDSTDLNVLIEQLKNDFEIYPLEIKDITPSEPKEIQVEAQDIFRKRSFKKQAFEIKIEIAFEGNKELFYCKPSISQNIYLDQIVIHFKHISAKIILDELDSAKYQNKVDEIVEELKVNIPTINSEIAPWNRGLENQIKQLLEQRKNIVSKKFDFMEKIGLKINSKSDEYMMPLVKKKIVPLPVSETTKGINQERIPMLQEDVYTDIKEVLYNVGKAIERKPSIYINKQEEDLRDIFLLFLETRYESTSGIGEAFNKKGKTDILLKYSKDGSNIFVAECKFWKGQKKLFQGIDQLLGYLTHRDSKTAILLFVDQKEIVSVVSTVKKEIKKHANFKQHVKDTYETSLSYDFSLPGDSRKIIQIEIMLYHFPG